MIVHLYKVLIGFLLLVSTVLVFSWIRWWKPTATMVLNPTTVSPGDSIELVFSLNNVRSTERDTYTRDIQIIDSSGKSVLSQLVDFEPKLDEPAYWRLLKNQQQETLSRLQTSLTSASGLIKKEAWNAVFGSQQDEFGPRDPAVFGCPVYLGGSKPLPRTSIVLRQVYVVLKGTTPGVYQMIIPKDHLCSRALQSKDRSLPFTVR